MNLVTASDVRLWSLVDFGSLGFPATTPDAKLQVYVDRAVASVTGVTKRPLTAVPDALVPLMQLAIQVRTEMLVAQAQPDYVETLADFDLIANFSAGPYSETRRGIGEAAQAKVLSSNPLLHGLLFELLSDEAREDYLLYLQGFSAPALAFAEIDMSTLVDRLAPSLQHAPYPEP